jgi:hypothetical protein
VGISLLGGIHQEAAGVVDGNMLAQMTLESETVGARETGIFVGGSLATVFLRTDSAPGSCFPARGFRELRRGNAAAEVAVRTSA